MQVNLALRLAIFRQENKIKDLEDKKNEEQDLSVKNLLQEQIDSITLKKDSFKNKLKDKQPKDKQP